MTEGVYLGQRVTTGQPELRTECGKEEEKTRLVDPCNVQDLGVFMYMLDGQTLWWMHKQSRENSVQWKALQVDSAEDRTCNEMYEQVSCNGT